MSAFYVGQRVRIVANLDGGDTDDCIGLEGVIIGDFATYNMRDDDDPSGPEFWTGWQVDVPASGSDFLVCGEGELEPIVDDGRKVVEWSDCLWQPEGVAA